MARIKIVDVIDCVDSDIRKALRDAVDQVIPGVTFDEYDLFRTFKRAVGRKCNLWESVPDNYIEKD